VLVGDAVRWWQKLAVLDSARRDLPDVETADLGRTTVKCR
jgi:hypothetical protein